MVRRALITLPLLLVACEKPTPEERNVQDNVAAYEQSLRNQADALDAMAGAAADANAADAMRNAADELDAARRNVAGAADARLANLQ